MLVLAIHTVATVSASVPFAMIMLRDHVRKSDVSPGLHCRLVLPSSGNRSVSLWDVPDRDTLQTWLDEFLDVDCSNEVFEVHEEFAYGVSEQLLRSRAADQVSEKAHQTASEVQQKSKRITENVKQQWDEVDQKFKVTEHTNTALKNAKETVAPVFSKVNNVAKQQYSKALENERVAAAAASVGGGFAAMKGSLGSWGTYLKGQADKVGETVAARAGSSPLAPGRPASSRSPSTTSQSKETLSSSAPTGALSPDATARNASQPATTSQSQTSQAPTQAAPKPPGATDDKLFTLDDLSSEDGGSPAAVKGLSGLSVSDSGQEVPKKAG